MKKQSALVAILLVAAAGAGILVWNQQWRQAVENSQVANSPWNSPIDFYGRVVDRNGNPVAGAEVVFKWAGLSEEDKPSKTTFSDPSGYFALQQAEGLGILVLVSKQGYHLPVPRVRSFYYSDLGNGRFHRPNAATPEMFVLKKKMPAESIIAVQKSFRIPKDGTPVEVDLSSGTKTVPGAGNLRVECWTGAKSDSGERFDWSCRVSIPNGGLIMDPDELNFEAPLDGYKPSDEIAMSSQGEQWQNNIKRRYFVRLPDGTYALVSLRMVPHGEHFFKMTSHLNPSGSRNLEFDPILHRTAPR